MSPTRLPDSLRRVAALSPAERGLAIRALLLLSLVPIAVRVRGLPPLLCVRAGRPGPIAPWRTGQIVASVAAHLPWTPSCLSRSLTAARLIAAAGGRSVLVLGVGPAGRPFEAHAWLEVEGRTADPFPDGRWREVSRWVVEGRAA